MRHLHSTFGAFIGAMLTATAVWAAEPCGDMVVDNLGLLSASDITRIEAAGTELEALGASVYVRLTADKLGYASLADAADNACPWQGDRIVFWIEDAGGDATILAGPAWNATLSESVLLRIIDNHMLPALGSGAFANGFIQPINEIAQLISPQGGTTIINEAAPAANEYSVMMIGIVVGGLLIVIVGGFLFTRWSRRNRLRRSAITLGEQAKNRLAEFNELSGAITKLLRREVVRELSDEVLRAFKARQEVLNTAADTVNEDFNGHVDPSTLGFNFGEYEALEESLRKSLAAITAKTEEFQALKAEIETAELQAKNAPERHIAVTDAYDSALARVKAVKQSGFTVTSILTALGVQKSELDAAKRLQEQKRYAEAEQKLATIEGAVTASAELAEELPRRKAAIETSCAALETRLGTMAQKVEVAVDAYERMEQTFDPSNYEIVEGDGAEAEERIDLAEDAIDAAEALAKDQKWDEAEHQVEVAQKLLAEADQLLDGVLAQEVRVNRARTEAPKELVEALRSRDKAETFIATVEDDITTSFTDAFRTVSDLCSSVEALLSAPRPDYIKALKLAMQADDVADTILDQAEDQHEAAERKRRRAESLRSEAFDAVGDAKRYVSNHAGDMKRNTLQQLSALQSSVDALGRERDTDRVIALAKALDKAVDACMELAKRDFNRAESARQEAAQKARKARQARDAASSVSVNRTWGSPTRPSTSATRRWNSGGARTSTSVTRSFRSSSPSRSTSATRKWK